MAPNLMDRPGKFNAEMLSLARQSRGLAQTALAKKTGFSQGKISRLEADIVTPSSEDIQVIAKVLEYPVTFFEYSGDIYGAGGDEIYHRARRKARINVLHKSYAEAEVRRVHVEKLLKSVDYSANEFPNYDPDEYDGDVAFIARSVRAAWRLPPGPVRDVVQIVEKSGGVVSLCRFNTQHIDGFSKRIAHLPAMFFLNVDMQSDRNRWTLAHEIGHMVMHHGAPEPTNEQEANEFASEFLTPEQEIRAQLRNLTIDKLASLKQYWKVSMQALVMRAHGLGLLTDRQRRSWFMRFSSLGYRKREPAELDPPREEPFLVKALVRFHKDNLGYSDEDLMKMLGINTYEYRQWYGERPTGLTLVK